MLQCQQDLGRLDLSTQLSGTGPPTAGHKLQIILESVLGPGTLFPALGSFFHGMGGPGNPLILCISEPQTTSPANSPDLSIVSMETDQMG